MTNENERIHSESQDTREWKDFRGDLNWKCHFSSETEQDWKRAIAIFSDRLDSYFLKPINFLIDNYDEENANNTRTKNIGEGFSIVTLQCALIETFAAFKKGQIHNINPQFDYQYKDCMSFFIEFLQNEEEFRNHFNKKDAEFFYTEVRCGLMHETRTKSSWLIQANAEIYKRDNPSQPNITADTILAKKGRKRRIIFRNQFQKALDRYFDSYKENLANPAEKFNELRKFLARKPDHLFDIDKDETFEWWKHQCICKYCNQINTN